MLRSSMIVFLVLNLAACGSGQSSAPEVNTPEPSEAEAPTSALDQMELVFEGGHSRDEIQAKLDESFALYGLEPTEDNYRRAGDVLVALSNNAMGEGCVACTEMGILDYLIQSGTLSGMEWHEAAAFSIAFLAAGPNERTWASTVAPDR